MLDVGGWRWLARGTAAGAEAGEAAGARMAVARAGDVVGVRTAVAGVWATTGVDLKQ
jgi:hypothetical protein